MRFLYVRVSSEQENLQNIDRQMMNIDSYDQIFIERKSGKDKKRPELQKMLNQLRVNDVVEVHSLDRFGRSLLDNIELATEIRNKGCELHILQEHINIGSQKDPMDDLVFQILSSIAEYERLLIHIRQAEGIKSKKAKGKKYHNSTRSKKLNKDQLKEINILFKGGMNIAELARRFNVSRPTIYSSIKNEKGC